MKNRMISTALTMAMVMATIKLSGPRSTVAATTVSTNSTNRIANTVRYVLTGTTWCSIGSSCASRSEVWGKLGPPIGEPRRVRRSQADAADQIQQRIQEHPHNVDKMPVQPA